MPAARVLMLLTNPYRPDPRVRWEAQALSEAGYPVALITWDRAAELLPAEDIPGLSIQRVQDVRSGYASGWKQLFHLPRFWLRAMQLGQAHNAQIIHCHDLDSLPAGVALKKRTGARLIYDAHENYPATLSLYLPKALICLLRRLEKFLLRYVDTTITASQVFATELTQQGVSPVTCVGNSADLAEYDAISSQEISHTRSQLGWADNQLIVAYLGGFTLDRLLMPFLETAATMPEVGFLIAGDGSQRAAVEDRAASLPNVKFLGWIAQSQVPLYTKTADVIYYALRPDYPGAQYNAPNTLGNALAAGRPMISNRSGDLGRILDASGSGLLLDDVQPACIVQAINSLKDQDYRRSLGKLARQFAEKTYNRAESKRQLMQVYRNLLEQ